MKRDTHIAFSSGLVVFVGGVINADLAVSAIAFASTVIVNVLVDIVGHERRGVYITRSAWSHSILFVSLASLALTAPLCYALGLEGWQPYLLSLLGGLSHLALDALTPAGVAPLWPFSSKRIRGPIRYDSRAVNAFLQLLGVLTLLTGLLYYVK